MNNQEIYWGEGGVVKGGYFKKESMINFTGLSVEQMERVQIARLSGKYGHLRTWGEICLFMVTNPSLIQERRILTYLAHKSVHLKEVVYLPLMDYPEVVQEALQAILKGYRCIKNITIREEVKLYVGEAEMAFRNAKNQKPRSKAGEPKKGDYPVYSS